MRGSLRGRGSRMLARSSACGTSRPPGRLNGEFGNPSPIFRQVRRFAEVLGGGHGQVLF